MKRLSFATSVLLLPSSLLFAQCAPTVNDECTFCEKLKDCGLLPSSLGVDQENCEKRCATSDAETMQALNQLVSAGLDGGPWCGERNSCATLATSLERQFPGAAGRVDVSVLPQLSGKAPEECSHALACPSVPGLRGSEAEGVCQQLNVGTVEYLVQVDEKWMSEPRGCLSGLTNPPVDLLPSGATRALVVLWGAQEAGESALRCVSFASRKTRVDATLECQSIPVLLAIGEDTALETCEATAALCSNGRDDDGDGLSDCLDPKCQTHCAGNLLGMGGRSGIEVQSDAGEADEVGEQ